MRFSAIAERGIFEERRSIILLQNLPECIPNKVKLSFFENQRDEWLKVLQTSEGGLSENRPESYMHWIKINSDAKERIREIEEKINDLKVMAQCQV